MEQHFRRINPMAFESAVADVRERIRTRGDLQHVSVERQLDLVDQLTQFEFGRHMLTHQGEVDGYWTYYAIRHNFTPFQNLKPLERFMFEKAPYMKAALQCFRNIQTFLQGKLKEGMLLASVPSGVMADLLTLDFRGLKRFELIGVDIDLKSNQYAQDLAFERGVTSHVHFYERDAWNLGLKNVCDGIVCNGLTCYEPNETKQADLYRQFHEALKPGGFLVLSFLTPPPGIRHRCEWVLDKISLEDALLQKVLFFDVLNSCWQTFFTTDQIRSLVQSAGFTDVSFMFDEARLIPIALASKS